MKALSKIAIGAAAAVGLGFAAAAFSQGPGMGYGMGYGQGGNGYGMGMHGPYARGSYGMGMHGPYGFAGYDAETLNTQLADLKTNLNITAEQAKAWEAFETAVRNQASSAQAMWTTMHSGQVNPETHYAIMQQRFTGMQAVWKARTDLYNVLTAEQKEAFDRTAAGSYCLRGYRG